VARVPDLGRSGEGWVALQSLLIGAIIACSFAGVSWPQSVQGACVVVGLVIAAAGAVEFVSGIAALGRSLTPLPRPGPDATFRGGGALRFARHPIYGGVLLLAFGGSLAGVPLGLAPTAALAVVFDLKARREEGWLDERYPEYADYRRRTRRRFIPGVY